MVKIVGAGPGAKDLITVRGMRMLNEADVIIYAGSLVNEELLEYAKKDCEIYNSAYMNLREVIDVIVKAEGEGKNIVRLHTGDPSLYGAIAGGSHEWRYHYPPLAQHGTSMAVFLSSSHLEELKEELYKGAFTPDTPCALCYKVSWEDEKCIRTTLKNLDSEAKKAGITRTALVLVGEFLGDKYNFSKLYDPEFTTEYRK